MITPRHTWFLKTCIQADAVKHSGRSLYDHLVGVHDLLTKWHAPEHVRLAGLFHSVYGTDTFKHQCIEPTPENRDLVTHFIGEEAEHLVHTFCTGNRQAFMQLGNVDLLEIEAANLLEQGSRGKTLRRLAQHPGISVNARAALRKALTEVDTGTKTDQVSL